MMPVSLDCPFSLPLLLENTEGVMKKDNPEKLASLGTQDTGQIHVREYPRVIKKKTIQVCLMLPVSLDCPFSLPLRYSLTFICPLSCVPYVANFSGLSFFLLPLGIL
jgi:hypothetical protein